MFASFKSDESGTATVQWVLITALIVGLALAALAVVGSGTQELSCDVAEELYEQAGNDAGNCSGTQIASAPEAEAEDDGIRLTPVSSDPYDPGYIPTTPTPTPIENEPGYGIPPSSGGGSSDVAGGDTPATDTPQQDTGSGGDTDVAQNATQPDTPASTGGTQSGGAAPQASADWSRFVPLDPHHRNAYGTNGVDANGQTWVEAAYSTWSGWSDAEVIAAYNASYAKAVAGHNRSRERREHIDNVTVLEQVMIDRGLGVPGGNIDAATLRGSFS